MRRFTTIRLTTASPAEQELSPVQAEAASMLATVNAGVAGVDSAVTVTDDAAAKTGVPQAVAQRAFESSYPSPSYPSPQVERPPATVTQLPVAPPVVSSESSLDAARAAVDGAWGKAA